MPNGFKSIDSFTRNVIVVFAGISLVSFFNLLYQLMLAHKLSAVEFSAFNSLLSIFIIAFSPLGTLQMAVAKYSAEFKAHNQVAKLKFLLSDLFKKILILAIFTLLLFWPASGYIIKLLRISSASSGYILAVLLASSWLIPVFLGGLQGLELFWWFVSAALLTGILKLIFAFISVSLGYGIAGALGALLAATVIGIGISYFPLRRFISIRPAREDINYKEILTYLFPMAISYFCFITLVSSDMVLVKYFFSAEDSGVYSLAQMVGKIFLFFPGAISMVMFPRTSGLNAKNLDTLSTLKKSLLYALGLCVFASAFYNFFPSLFLKLLTGKAYPNSIFLGRLFSVSMSFYAVLYILIWYFLSIKDLRFIKYLFLSTLMQSLGILFFHQSLIRIQMILCINSLIVFFILLFLANKK